MSCGTCATGEICEDGSCVCQLDCTGKTCGSDGCGGSCGNCTGGTTCVSSTCLDLDYDNDGSFNSVDCNDIDEAIFPGAIELCDGIDNNCTAGIDEGFGVGEPCDGADADLCINGTTVCTSTGYASACLEAEHFIEVCNGLDDDCDGQTDEDFGSTCCGTGVCTTCVENCAGGSWQVCEPLAGSPEVCDNIDNDCDGETDETYVSIATTCGEGACVSSGSMVCINGDEFDTCVPGEPAASDTTCDGIDDDCDGDPSEPCPDLVSITFCPGVTYDSGIGLLSCSDVVVSVGPKILYVLAIAANISVYEDTVVYSATHWGVPKVVQKKMLYAKDPQYGARFLVDPGLWTIEIGVIDADGSYTLLGSKNFYNL